MNAISRRLLASFSGHSYAMPAELALARTVDDFCVELEVANIRRLADDALYGHSRSPFPGAFGTNLNDLLDQARGRDEALDLTIAATRREVTFRGLLAVAEIAALFGLHLVVGARTWRLPADTAFRVHFLREDSDHNFFWPAVRAIRRLLLQDGEVLVSYLGHDGRCRLHSDCLESADLSASCYSTRWPKPRPVVQLWGDGEMRTFLNAE